MNIKLSLFKLAEDLTKKGELIEAADAYRSILPNVPGQSFAHHNFAILLRKLNQFEEAIEHAQKAYEISPDNATILLSLGLSYEMGGLLAKAEQLYKKSIEIDPHYTAALNNLGHILDSTERPLEALPILQKAHKLDPHDMNISLNLGNVCISLGRPSEAKDLIKDLKTAAAHNSLGIIRYVQRDWIGAKAQFKRALSIQPDFAGAHENLALTLLHLGEYEEGWIEYDWRWQNKTNGSPKSFSNTPIWNGQQLSGKILLLHSEQGLGDTIQFIRYANMLEKKGGKIFLACQTELVDLLNNAPGIDYAYVMGSNNPPHDFHASLVSLPKIIDDLGDKSNKPNSYLNVSPGRITPSSFNNNLKIGICWAGKARHIHDPHRNRSCPIRYFEILTKIPNVEIYNLQVKQVVNENPLPLRLKTFFPAISTFQDTAKAISNLDLVVSIDTAVIHLTGALGKPGIVILNYAADWRWGDGFGPAPWYPSIQMFRQTDPGNWENVFQKVSAFIQKTYLPQNQDQV